MRTAAALLSLAIGWPTGAPAESLTYGIWASDDPAQTIFCAVHLTKGKMIAVEVKGLGMPPHGTMQWSPTQVEVTAMTTALQALLETSLVDSDVIVSRTPVPPYLSVTWFTELDGALVSGLYYGNLQPLPDPLDRVIRTILPGGLCDKALN